jgi:hypothetical protein
VTDLQNAVKGLTDEIDAGGPRYLLGLLADAIEDENPDSDLPYALRKIMLGRHEPAYMAGTYLWICDRPHSSRPEPCDLWFMDWERLEWFDDRWGTPRMTKVYASRSKAFLALAMLPFYRAPHDDIPF